MKVEAIRDCFVNHSLRRKGDIFEWDGGAHKYLKPVGEDIAAGYEVSEEPSPLNGDGIPGEEENEEASAIEETEEIPAPAASNGLICPKCGRRCYTKLGYDKHVAACKGAVEE